MKGTDGIRSCRTACMQVLGPSTPIRTVQRDHIYVLLFPDSEECVVLDTIATDRSLDRQGCIVLEGEGGRQERQSFPTIVATLYQSCKINTKYSYTVILYLASPQPSSLSPVKISWPWQASIPNQCM